MSCIRVLIADDSVVYRSLVKAALDSMPYIEVVSVVSSGKLAIEKLLQSSVDLFVIDLEDSLVTLGEMKKHSIECKILIFSSLSPKNSNISLNDIKLEVSDIIIKPDISDEDLEDDRYLIIRRTLERKIAALFPYLEDNIVDLIPHAQPNINGKINMEQFSPKIVVIGSSTGGPTVLERIFSNINGPLKCPVVITQHMPPLFTTSLAARLSKVSGIRVKEATHGEVLDRNCIYVAPGDYHLCLQESGDLVHFSLNQGPYINSVRPAVDHLFICATKIFKDQILGIILTGMGADGMAGAAAIKKNGGAIVIQDEKSCVVYGMPKAVYQAGHFDMIATPTQIVDLLIDKITFRDYNSQPI